MEENKSKDVQSLVQTASSITGSFSKLKFITVSAVVVACLSVAGIAGYAMYTIAESQKQVYVIEKGQVLSATRENLSISLRDRIEFQSKNLHRLLFTISPNREVVTANVEKALEISDRSVYNYYQDLNEKKFYQRMYQAGASQDIEVDSVKIDISRHPYRVATYATVTITRESNITKSRLLTRCSMIDVDMNRKNREGLQVENFEVLRNDEIGTRKR